MCRARKPKKKRLSENIYRRKKRWLVGRGRANLHRSADLQLGLTSMNTRKNEVLLVGISLILSRKVPERQSDHYRKKDKD
mmetsp:Transcript_49160/g.104632  ORF Transcript_49160/g.104632 Transcript_49160/m.104632 type:complete len:80 (-) Transcript_49160:2134-2373(-)